ncbi:STAS domain-containing protein [bacterium]|nr:STAS domain-containing protein [bacterium]
MVEIRIDITSEGPEQVVRVAGRLTASAVEQLRKACAPIGGVFVLDLSSLMFADDAGIEAVRATGEKGAKIRGASPFIQLLLDDTAGKGCAGKE